MATPPTPAVELSWSDGTAASLSWAALGPVTLDWTSEGGSVTPTGGQGTLDFSTSDGSELLGV